MEPQKFDFLTGEVLLINKPLTWTSFDVVNKIRLSLRRALGVKKIKVGHAGTLDPLASGLLIICTGRATKTIESIQDLPKTYTGTMTFGATRPSYDMETEINKTYPIDHLNENNLREATEKYKGKIMQVPPAFSAIKIDGKRAYEMARKDINPNLKAREVTVYDFTLSNINLPNVDFEVQCSKGTYIRSLVHDFAIELNSGGYLSKLERTAIGDFSLDNALTIDQFEKLVMQIGK